MKTYVDPKHWFQPCFCNIYRALGKTSYMLKNKAYSLTLTLKQLFAGNWWMLAT